MSLVDRLNAARLVEPSARSARGISSTHLVFATAAAVFLISLILAAGFGWSSALPLGFATFAASLLVSMAVSEFRGNVQTHSVGAPQLLNALQQTAMLDRIAGLVTRHDAAGQLLSAHGLDKATFGFAQPHVAADFLDHIHISGRISFLQAVDALRQGARTATAEFLLGSGHHEATFRPVRASLSADFGTDGSLRGFLCQSTDITEEMRLRDDAAAWKTEARTANEAKTRFLAAVSHELRTPLNAILGFSDILTGEYFGKFENDRQKEYVELINQSGHHLLAVVNTMLDMSKIEAGRYELIKEPFSIASAVRAVDEMLALEAKIKGVVLNARVARGLDEVTADRRAIQQVLINLANNAIKFTKTGGVVTIDANCDSRNLLITVSDTGIGIPAEKLSQIGKPFMQVQNDYTRQYEGTGLGLALVKGLVALHGGTFDIASEEGKGTIITISIPLNGEGEAGAETFEFPPRLREQNSGEYRDGAAQAKTA